MSVSLLNTTNLILIDVDYYLNGYFLPFIIVFGVIGNISNIYIFTRPSLFRSCSMYFLAGAVNGLVLLLFGTTTRWIGHTFPKYDATRTSIFFCRFRNYLMNIIYNLAAYFTACVTIDRFCSSSTDANMRRLSSQPKVAYAVIILTTIVSFIAYCHNLIYYTIIDQLCQTQSGFYTRFFSFFATVYYFAAVFAIIIFGSGTVYNVRAQRIRIQPILMRGRQVDQKRLRVDGQILIMLLIHVGCYVCFAMPYHITMIVAAIYPSLVCNPTFLFVQRVTIITLNFNQAIDCYVYTLTTALYRKQIKLLLQRIFKKPVLVQNHRLAVVINQTNLIG